MDSAVVPYEFHGESDRLRSRLTGTLLFSVVGHCLFAVLIVVVSIGTRRVLRPSLAPTITIVSVTPQTPEPVRAELPPAPARATPQGAKTEVAPTDVSHEATPSATSTTARDTSAGSAEAIEGISSGEVVGRSPVATPGAGATGQRGPLRVGSASQLDNTEFEPYGPKPAYPEIARVSRIEGFVDVDLVINEQGRVETFSLLSVSGHPLFGDETAKVLPRWRFPPPRIGGRKARISYGYRVDFRLHE